MDLFVKHAVPVSGRTRVRTDDLMHAFDRVRRRDLFDSTVAETVLPQYA
jgi:hypothetical protein